VFYGAEPNSLVPFVVGAGGGLIMLMFFPRGLAGIVFDVRDLLIRRLAPDSSPLRVRAARPTIRELVTVAAGRDQLRAPAAVVPAETAPVTATRRELVQVGAEGEPR